MSRLLSAQVFCRDIRQVCAECLRGFQGLPEVVGRISLCFGPCSGHTSLFIVRRGHFCEVGASFSSNMCDFRSRKRIHEADPYMDGSLLPMNSSMDESDSLFHHGEVAMGNSSAMLSPDLCPASMSATMEVTLFFDVEEKSHVEECLRCETKNVGCCFASCFIVCRCCEQALLGHGFV